MPTKTSSKRSSKQIVIINSLGERLNPDEAVDVLLFKSEWPLTPSFDKQIDSAWIRGYRVWNPVEVNPETNKTTVRKLKPITRKLWQKGSILVYRQSVIEAISQQYKLDSRPTAYSPDRVRRHQSDAIQFEQFFGSVSTQGVVLVGVERAEAEDLRLGAEGFSQSDESEESIISVDLEG
jgi:hypothetical protein